MKLMDFHQGRTLLASGHRRADLLTLTDADFERHHGFIQWAFPTPEQSHNNFSATPSALASQQKPDLSKSQTSPPEGWQPSDRWEGY